MQTPAFAFTPRIYYEAVTIRFPTPSIAVWDPNATIVAVLPANATTNTITDAITTNWLAVGLALLLAALAVRGFFHLRTTTLGAPCLWVALSAVCLAIGSYLEPDLKGISLATLQYSMAVTTLCPLMAVLGAKRPQDRGWQWIVLSLWVVLVLPAGQAILLPAGNRLELFAAWKMFLWGLIAFGAMNYLPTRHWLAAILIAAGQVLLLRDQLGFETLLANHSPQILAIGCLFLAALSVSWSTHKRQSKPEPKSSPPTLAAQETVWLNFRDSFGALWALRILGRVNHAAELRQWPMLLNWSGFTVAPDQEPTEKQLTDLDQTINGLLRRFVTEEK